MLTQQPAAIYIRFLHQYESYQRFTGQIADSTTAETEPSSEESIVDERTPLELFESSYAKLKAALREELLSRLIECSPKFFEHIVVKL